MSLFKKVQQLLTESSDVITIKLTPAQAAEYQEHFIEDTESPKGKLKNKVLTISKKEAKQVVDYIKDDYHSEYGIDVSSAVKRSMKQLGEKLKKELQ